MTKLEAQLQPIIARFTAQLVAEIQPLMHDVVRATLLASLAELDAAPAVKPRSRPKLAGRPRRVVKRSAPQRPRRKANPPRQAEQSTATAEQKPPAVNKTTPTVNSAPDRRPCGCAARGRHASTCAEAGKGGAKPATIAVSPSAPVPKVKVDTARASRFAAIEDAARRRNGASA